MAADGAMFAQVMVVQGITENRRSIHTHLQTKVRIETRCAEIIADCAPLEQ